MANINFGCFSIDIVDLTSRLCTCIKPHAAYLCKFEKKLDDLSTAKRGLTELKDEVNRKVDIAEVQQQEKRLERVQGWLSRVGDLEAEVEKLITVDGPQEIEKNCLGGCCPNNCWSRYKLGKKVVEKINEVTSLEKEGRKFTEVAGKRLLASGSSVERPSSETVGLDSAFEEVESYINGDEQVGIIGIYGMGGVGKTTLLTQINNNLRTNFDLVIWVVVSRNSTIEKVQDGIAECMGFHDDKWKNKSEAEKTRHIFGVLNRKKFLLLLDDIWEGIDLVEVGVPIPKKHNNTSKIVFTTRSEDVCGRMKAKKQIKVNCLRPSEAWNLFLENIGEATINSHPEILEKAKIVVDECNGLPLALITIGQAMARKMNPQEWDRAAQVLKENAAKFSDMGDRVLPLLKFSYDSLQSDTYRSCFLYCILFPEDYLISKERLIEYWIGEGFLDDINDGYDIIGTLIRSCLLEEDSDDCVKMHDVIRDMALWIACECGKVEDKCLVQALDKKKTEKFFVQAGSSLKETPEIEKWKGVERMSLMHNEIKELAETPLCPNLLTLFLNDNGRHLTMITPGFFQNMPNLRVLDLSNNDFLEELRVEISRLASLQYLNLSKATIRVLPIEYKNLVELKYLNLEYTDELRTIPQGLLSSFKKLRVLKMYRCRYSFRSFELETFVKEVEGLKELNHLSLSIRTVSGLSRALRSPKVLSCTKLLSIFHVLGLEYQDMSVLLSMRCLHQLVFLNCRDLEDLRVERAAEGMANSEIIASHLLRFRSLRSVNIDHCRKLKDVTWLIFAPNLEILTINECDGMEEAICGSEIIANHLLRFRSLRSVNIDHCMNLKDVTWLIFAPNLEILTINVCDGMVEVICGGKWDEASSAEEAGYLNLFPRLKELILLHLPQLKSIYPNALPFTCLKSIKVTCCPNLKKLPLNSDSAKGCAVAISGNIKWRNALVWEDEATQKAFLPSFKF